MRWRKLSADLLAFTFTILAVTCIYLFELLIVLPTVHPLHTFGYYAHIVAGTYLLVSVFSCLYLIMSLDTTPSATGIILPSILKPGWRFCSFCEYNAPPRSFHCHVCDKCIMKRDHHCVFAGTCIGYANHRYFITLLMHTCIAGIYANIMNFDYTWEVLGGLTWRSAFSMFLPLVSYVTGVTQAFSFTVALVSSMCIMGFLLILALLIYHGILIFNGQTVYEQNNKVRDYDHGCRANITEVMGKYWYIAWISPWLPSPLLGNGIDFEKRVGKVENVKDM